MGLLYKLKKLFGLKTKEKKKDEEYDNIQPAYKRPIESPFANLSRELDRVTTRPSAPPDYYAVVETVKENNNNNEWSVLKWNTRGDYIMKIPARNRGESLTIVY